MKNLSQVQKKFLKKYAETLDIKGSAIFGGYSEKIAEIQGASLLKKEKYLKALDFIVNEEISALQIPKAFIVKKYLQLINWAGKPKQEKGNEGNEDIEISKELIRENLAPQDPTILLRALDSLVKYLEKDKIPQTDTTSPFSQILGVNCEKI